MSTEGKSKARVASEKRQKKLTENPFLAAQEYGVQDNCAVKDDASAFVLLPKDGRVITLSKTSFFNLHRKLPTLQSDDSCEILQSFFRVCTQDRKDGLHNKSLCITEDCITELNGLLDKVDGFDSEFCCQKTLELDEDCFPELEGKGNKKRPKISESKTTNYYTRGQAMARFIPAILSGDIAFGKKMNMPAKAFATKFVFGLPDVLPVTGSDAAKKLFEDSVLGRLFGYCDDKVLSVLHHEDGLPMYHTDAGRASIIAGEYPARVLDADGNSSIPKFDLFYTISFSGMPLHNEWSQPLDGRCCLRASPFMYDIIKRAAFALLGNKDTWPAVLVHLFDKNEKNDLVDLVALAKNAYKEKYADERIGHILAKDTDEMKAQKARNYTVCPYRNPSNTLFFQEAGSTAPSKYDQTLYYGSISEKAFVQLQFVAVGTQDCDAYTAAAFKAHKAKTKNTFAALWKLDGALSKNSMFKATAIALHGTRGVPEVDGSTSDEQYGGNARGAKSRRTNASMASEITSLKTVVAETNAKLDQTHTKLAEMTELMLEMKTMLPAATAAP